MWQDISELLVDSVQLILCKNKANECLKKCLKKIVDCHKLEVRTMEVESLFERSVVNL